MKIVAFFTSAVLATAVLVWASGSQAGFRCQTLGNVTNCHDDGGNSTRCVQIGNFLRCY